MSFGQGRPWPHGWTEGLDGAGGGMGERAALLSRMGATAPGAAEEQEQEQERVAVHAPCTLLLLCGMAVVRAIPDPFQPR